MNSEPRANFRTVKASDFDYPKSLRELADKPPVLYIQGRWPIPEKNLIGIVGTRHATEYGLEATEQFTIDLVRQGMTTVSGLAAGIDACAHRATLEEGGWTVAVLGHGFGYQYPKQNASLFADIAARGTLITEFSYATKPDSLNFPKRNRIISGLSQGVLVVEAGHRSGASITARYAAEQGRDVFVIPGNIFSSQSVGCHRLIKEGARLVDSAGEILEEYGIGSRAPDVDRETIDAGHDDLSSTEKEIMNLMSGVPLSIDELVQLSGWPVDRLAEVLLSLEIKGRVHHKPGQLYVS